MPTDPALVKQLPFSDDKQQFVIQKLDPVLEEMVADVLGDHPAKPLDYMINWLKKKGGRQGVDETTLSVAALNKRLKAEISRHTDNLNAATEGNETDDHSRFLSKQSEFSAQISGDDEAHLPPMTVKQLRKRFAISADAQGKYQAKVRQTLPKHSKTDQQLTWLLATFKETALLRGLDVPTLQNLIDCAEHVSLPAGKIVQEQGRDENTLFFVESGVLEITSEAHNAGYPSDHVQDEPSRECREGDVVNHLSLLYRVARGPRVVAKEASTCWQVERELLDQIVKEGQEARRVRHGEFLRNLPLTAGLSPEKREELIDVLEVEEFYKGDAVYMKGSEGDKMYFVEDGKLYEVTSDHGVHDPKRTAEFEEGGHFGDMALLSRQVRDSSIVVESETATLVSLHRLSFEGLLGKLSDEMGRQASPGS